MSPFRKKKEGPFKANRILDTNQLKVDQIFTKEEEKPVALLLSITEDEARRIGAEAFAGPTNMGIKGKYHAKKNWVTQGFYWPENVGGAVTEDVFESLKEAAINATGAQYPPSLTFTRIIGPTEIPISGTAIIKTDSKGTTQISGDVAISGSTVIK